MLIERLSELHQEGSKAESIVTLDGVQNDTLGPVVNLEAREPGGTRSSVTDVFNQEPKASVMRKLEFG